MLVKLAEDSLYIYQNIIKITTEGSTQFCVILGKSVALATAEKSMCCRDVASACLSQNVTDFKTFNNLTRF